ncbi:hypothetical protein LJC46_09560, partial [Desulfovibrio sp. OttesenSCG-928-G15]|nr:hypothetical protein [Desulfovibrio sp. OttesenSCG-928-G15]
EAARALGVLEEVYGKQAPNGPNSHTSHARQANSGSHASPLRHTRPNCCAGHFIPFFRGMLFLRTGDLNAARHWFATARPLQPDAEATALCAFYEGYALTLEEDWLAAASALADAVAAAPDMKEYRNLYGVALFRLGRHAEAAAQFSDVVVRLDRGSAMDWQNLGLCRKCMGDAAGARQALEAALSIEPGLEAAQKHLDELPA